MDTHTHTHTHTHSQCFVHETKPHSLKIISKFAKHTHAQKLIQGQSIMCKATMSRAGKLVTIPRGTETQEEIRAGRPCLRSSLKVSNLFLSHVTFKEGASGVLCFRRPHSNPLSQLTFTPVLTGFPSKSPSEGRLSWQKVVVVVQN